MQSNVESNSGVPSRTPSSATVNGAGQSSTGNGFGAAAKDVAAERLRSAGAAKTLGIVGGGQLAGMMIEAAQHLNLDVVVMDPDSECCAAGLAREAIVADFDSVDGLRELAKRSDVVTFEIERVSTDALSAIESEGAIVAPSSKVLAIIQDKLLQKRFLQERTIPTTEFHQYETSRVCEFGLPCVWKARRDGYDGRGVSIIRELADFDKLPDAPALLERQADIKAELAIVVARTFDGQHVCYPVVEIVMDPTAHVLDSVIAPANVSEPVRKTCEQLALEVVSALDYVGVLAVEFFLTGNGDVLVNEISPRPHNSGHYTIEACKTSQFEQHLRAVTGRALGEIEFSGAALSFNLLSGGTQYESPRADRLGDLGERVYVHDYGKPSAWPGRKMGHITILGSDRESLLAHADQVRKLIAEGDLK